MIKSIHLVRSKWEEVITSEIKVTFKLYKRIQAMLHFIRTITKIGENSRKQLEPMSDLIDSKKSVPTPSRIRSLVIVNRCESVCTSRVSKHLGDYFSCLPSSEFWVSKSKMGIGIFLQRKSVVDFEIDNFFTDAILISQVICEIRFSLTKKEMPLNNKLHVGRCFRLLF